MELEDEVIAIEVVGLNAQAAVPLLLGTPLLMAMAVALVGTAFCLAKSWHRHRRLSL